MIGLNNLSKDLYTYIGSFLDIKSLGRLSQTSKKLSQSLNKAFYQKLKEIFVNHQKTNEYFSYNSERNWRKICGEIASGKKQRDLFTSDSFKISKIELRSDLVRVCFCEEKIFIGKTFFVGSENSKINMYPSDDNLFDRKGIILTNTLGINQFITGSRAEGTIEYKIFSLIDGATKQHLKMNVNAANSKSFPNIGVMSSQIAFIFHEMMRDSQMFLVPYEEISNIEISSDMNSALSKFPSTTFSADDLLFARDRIIFCNSDRTITVMNSNLIKETFLENIKESATPFPRIFNRHLPLKMVNETSFSAGYVFNKSSSKNVFTALKEAINPYSCFFSCRATIITYDLYSKSVTQWIIDEDKKSIFSSKKGERGFHINLPNDKIKAISDCSTIGNLLILTVPLDLEGWLNQVFLFYKNEMIKKIEMDFIPRSVFSTLDKFCVVGDFKSSIIEIDNLLEK